MKKTILLVEDEESLRHALKIKLVNAGYEVIEAENGKVGLDMALRHQPDLILLDIVMPVMDGVTMLEKLRADDKGANLDVIMLTNLNDTGKVESAEKSDVSDYLIKTDWTLQDLLKLIEKKIG